MAYSRRRTTRAPKRRLFWARDHGLSTFGDTDPNSRIRNLLGQYQDLAGSDVEGVTVTRIRGKVAVQSFSAFTGPVLYSLGFKIDDSYPTGVIDPDEVDDIMPATFQGSDWMYSQNFWHNGILADAEDSNINRIHTELSTVYVDVDVKSQRRMDEVGESLYMFHGFPEGSYQPDSGIVAWDLNILLKRP